MCSPSQCWLPNLRKAFFLSFAVLTWLGVQSAAQTVADAPAVDFGSVNVAAPSSSTVTFTFSSNATLTSTAVVTQGVAGLDFTDDHTGTCAAGSYTAGSTCTIGVKFTPMFAGLRQGAAILKDSGGDVLATAYLYGTGTGAQITFLPTSHSGAPLSETALNVSGTVSADPVGLATDAFGDVFVSDAGNGQVVKLVPTGGGGYTQVTATTGLDGPRGIAVDGAGNLYIADMTAGALYEVVWNGGSYGSKSPLNIGSGHSPAGVAVDSRGEVFFTDGLASYAGVLQSGLLTPLNLSGVSQASGLAFDAAGDLFVTDITGNQLVELPAAFTPWTGTWGSPTVVVASGTGLSAPARFAIDASGGFDIADTGNHRVAKVACTNSSSPCTAWGAPTTAITGLSGSDTAYDAALDASGNLFVAVFSGSARLLKEDYADAPSLSFAQTEVSATSTDSPQTVTIGNIGNATLSLEGVPSIPADFDLSGSTCTTSLESSGLMAGLSCDVSVSFNPWQAGNPLTEQLTLTDNNLGAGASPFASQTLQFSGVAYAQPLLSPSSANFSQVQTTTSNGWTFNLSNTGSVPFTGITISITNLVGTGAHIPVSLTGVFKIQSTACGGTLSGDGQTVTGASLNAYSSCNIVVTFTPPATGDSSDSYTGNLEITDSSHGSPVTATLSGTGTAVQVDLSPSSFDFGSGVVGGSWQTQTATLTNGSGGTLTVNSITIATTTSPSTPSSAFTITSTTCGSGTVASLSSSFTVAPNAHCTITMAFSPDQGAGSYAGALTVSENGSPASATVTLTGTATAQSVWLSPSAISFSNQTAGSVSSPWTVTLNNSTNAAVTIQSIGIGGFDPADFAETTDCAASFPATLNANTTCHIYVKFQPQSQGTFNGTLTVSYGTGPSTTSIPLTGMGTAITAGLAPIQLNFGSVVDDGSSTAVQNAVLTNTSGGPLGHIVPSVSSGGPVFYIDAGGNTCPAAPATLSAGGTCTIAVTFKPNAVQTFNGTLTVTDDAGTQTSSLLGVGTTSTPPSSSVNVYFSPASINFGDQNAGTTSSLWGMSVNNTGNTDVTIPATGLVLSDTTDFTLVPANPCAGVTLGPGNSSCQFQIQFNPPAPWPPTETTLPVTGSGTVNPAAVVVDANGDIYVSDFGNDQVVELTPTGSGYNQTVIAQSTSTPALVSPRGLALDPTGNLYIADNGGNQILKVACPAGACGAPSALVSGLSNGPQDVAYDPTGNVWFTMWGDASVWSVSAAGGSAAAVSLPNTFSQPLGLAWQTSSGTDGNLFVSDYNNNTVTELTRTSGTWSAAAQQPVVTVVNPTRIAVDSAGNLYLADTSNNRVVKLPWSGTAWGTQITVPTTTLSSPVGASLDSKGNLYIADWQNHRVLKESTGAFGAKTATLSATYIGGGGGTITAALAGNSIASDVAVSPSSLNFANVVQGTTSSAQTLTVTDTGNGPVTILSAVLSDSTDFTISGGTCSAWTVLTSSNPSCTIQVEFTPQTAQSFSGVTLTITDTGSGSPRSVTLNGTGISNTPSGQFSPNALTFGNQLLGATSQPVSVTLNNNGNVAFNPSGIWVSGDFAIPAGTNHCASLSSLAPGSSCSFQVTFTPSGLGPLSGTLTAGSSSPLNTVTASLTGSGYGATISISPGSLNFGSMQENTGPSPAQYVTVTNTSGGTLTIAGTNGITVSSPYNVASGANACTNGTQLVGSGSSCNIYVTFSPTTTGTLNSTLTVASDASNGAQTSNLYGSGTGPGSMIIQSSSYTLTANPASLTLKAGQQGTVAFTLAPSGGYKGTVALSCGDVPDGVGCSFSPASLAADGSNTPQTAQLTITTSGGQSAAVRKAGGGAGTALGSILLWPGLLVGGLLAWQRKRFSGYLKLGLVALALLFTLAGSAGCSGIHLNSTPQGTHVLTITASSSAAAGGTVTNKQTGSFTLTITQ